MPLFDHEYTRADGRAVRVFRLTDAEIAAADAQAQYERDLAVCLQSRREAYEATGWFSEFDIIDDAARRGWEAVNAERLAIKARYPKPSSPGVLS